MKVHTFKTKCTVRLQKSLTSDNEYYLFVEAYPVFEKSHAAPKRKATFLNRVVSTVIWDSKKPTRGGNPSRNAM